MHFPHWSDVRWLYLSMRLGLSLCIGVQHLCTPCSGSGACGWSVPLTALVLTCPLVLRVLQLDAHQAWLGLLQVPLFVQVPVHAAQALGAPQDLTPQRAALPVVHLPVRHHVA